MSSDHLRDLEADFLTDALGGNMAFTPDDMKVKIRELLDAHPVVDGERVYLFQDAVREMVDALTSEQLGDLFRWGPVTINHYAAMERATSRYYVPTDEVTMGLIEDICLAHLDEEVADDSIRRWQARLESDRVLKS